MKRDLERIAKVKKYITENYTIFSDYTIADKLKMKRDTIARIRKRLGLRKNRELVRKLHTMAFM